METLVETQNEHLDSLGSGDGLNEPLFGYQKYNNNDHVISVLIFIFQIYFDDSFSGVL